MQVIFADRLKYMIFGRGWKALRVESALAAIDALYPRLPSLEVMRISPAATLVMTLCWTTNAQANRPRSNQCFQVLEQTMSVHERVNGEWVPARPLRAWFLNAFHTTPWPRVSSQRCLGLATMAELCGILTPPFQERLFKLIQRTGKPPKFRPEPTSWQDAAKQIVGSTGLPLQDRKPDRRSRLEVFIDADAPDIINEVDGAQLIDEDHTAFSSEDEDPEQQHQGLSKRERVNHILKKMTAEILAKVPSDNTGKFSWGHLSAQELEKVRFDTLCDSKKLPNLLLAFRQASSQTLWDSMVRRMFPSVAELRHMQYGTGTTLKTSYMQGLTQCGFWQDWNSMLAGMSEKDREIVIRVARKSLNQKAQWLPLGESDRMWSPKPSPKDKTIHGDRPRDERGEVWKKTGMVVVLNPKFVKDMKLAGGH